MKDLTIDHKVTRAYDPSFFRAMGHHLIDLLSDHFEGLQKDQNTPVLNYQNPDDELNFWQNNLSEESGMKDFFEHVLQRSIKVHHPRYMGHQMAVPAFVASLAGLMSDALSNGTGVYEMGMASNAIEKVVTDFVARKIGYDDESSGFLTSGGSLGNLTALLAARKAKAPDAVWENGYEAKLSLLVSEEAHYCVDRAARILGFGSEGIIKVPVDHQYKIRTDLLHDYLQEARNDGRHVIAIVGCASSTSTGSYDDLDALADFAQEHDLWFHVDGAHGGGVVFSEHYRYLARGIERADSVVIDFHKMLMTPALNTALIFKKAEDSYKTFVQKAHYLWDAQQSEEWFNSGRRTFECTKYMMSIKFYTLLKTFGDRIFEENINYLYDLARAFAKLVKERPAFELALDPEANIVNFRYINSTKELNSLNSVIRQTLIDSGKFYIVQTMIGEKRYLRTALMNPMTRETDLIALLDEIERVGQTRPS